MGMVVIIGYQVYDVGRTDYGMSIKEASFQIGLLGLFQFGGKEWRTWNEAMQKALIENQRQGTICEDGSWDPIDEWGIAGGRVYTTAVGAMTLEVFYRFERHQEGVAY